MGGLTANNPSTSQLARAFVLTFGGGSETSCITSVTVGGGFPAATAVRHSDKPAAKDLYANNGRKAGVAVK